MTLHFAFFTQRIVKICKNWQESQIKWYLLMFMQYEKNHYVVRRFDISFVHFSNFYQNLTSLRCSTQCSMPIIKRCHTNSPVFLKSHLWMQEISMYSCIPKYMRCTPFVADLVIYFVYSKYIVSAFTWTWFNLATYFAIT